MINFLQLSISIHIWPQFKLWVCLGLYQLCTSNHCHFSSILLCRAIQAWSVWWIEIWTLSLVSLIWPHQVINTVIVSHYCTALASNLRSLSCLTTNALPAHGVLRTPSVFFFSRIFLLIAVFVYPLHFSGRAAEKHPKRPDIAIAMLHGKYVVFLTMFMSNKFNFAP